MDVETRADKDSITVQFFKNKLPTSTSLEISTAAGASDVGEAVPSFVLRYLFVETIDGCMVTTEWYRVSFSIFCIIVSNIDMTMTNKISILVTIVGVLL